MATARTGAGCASSSYDATAGLCQECKRLGLVGLAIEGDHIKPKAKGGDDHVDNLEAICAEHHVEKSMREQGRTRRLAIGPVGLADRMSAAAGPGWVESLELLPPGPSVSLSVIAITQNGRQHQSTSSRAIVRALRARTEGLEPMNHEMTPENTKHLADLTENAIRVFVDALDRYEHRESLEAALQSGRIVETIVSLRTNLATSDPTIVVELVGAGGERHEIYRHVGHVARTSH